MAALLDFGDMVHSAVVGDLAIGAAYAMLGKRDPLSAAREVIGHYCRAFPLTAAEADAVFPLIGTRLAMSVCYEHATPGRRARTDISRYRPLRPGGCSRISRRYRRDLASRPAATPRSGNGGDHAGGAQLRAARPKRAQHGDRGVDHHQHHQPAQPDER